MVSPNVAELLREGTSDCPIEIDKVVEIIEDRLYFASIDGKPRSNSQVQFVPLNDEINYERSDEYFGPVNLAVLYDFCINLKSKLEMYKRLVLHTTSAHPKRVNGAYLIGSYAIIYLNHTAVAVWNQLQKAQPPEFPSFPNMFVSAKFRLTLVDVLKGVEKAVNYGWLNFDTFNADEYRKHLRENVPVIDWNQSGERDYADDNCALNWIIPGRIIAFPEPSHHFHDVQHYWNYFEANNVTTVIRLNNWDDDNEGASFRMKGFEHINISYIDGTVPSDDILDKFYRAVDQAEGAVAVHCVAGWGRTGTAIACWMMKEYDISATECIAWIRICREYCVFGKQQQFLVDKELLQKFIRELESRPDNQIKWNAVTDIPWCEDGEKVETIRKIICAESAHLFDTRFIEEADSVELYVKLRNTSN